MEWGFREGHPRTPTSLSHDEVGSHPDLGRDQALGCSFSDGPSPFLLGPSGTCLVSGVLVDDSDILTVWEPQEPKVLGSLQVVIKVIEDLQQPEETGLVGDCSSEKKGPHTVPRSKVAGQSLQG